MRSPTHWDGVACRHGDRLTRYLEDAVDEADDAAEGLPNRVGGGHPEAADHPQDHQGLVSRPRGGLPVPDAKAGG